MSIKTTVEKHGGNTLHVELIHSRNAPHFTWGSPQHPPCQPQALPYKCVKTTLSGSSTVEPVRNTLENPGNHHSVPMEKMRAWSIPSGVRLAI